MNWESASVRKRHIAPPELDRLELKIRGLVDAHDGWRTRALRAEARAAELEQAVRELSSGGLDPVALSDEVQALNERNRALTDRMQRARDAVQRMLARLQFAEEER
jgi:hypothetical protein